MHNYANIEEWQLLFFAMLWEITTEFANISIKIVDAVGVKMIAIVP